MSEYFQAGTEILTENIPDELQQGKRFVGYRLEDRKGQPKPAKMPYSPDAPKGASSTAPAEWTTFDLAVKYAQVAHLDGVMRAFDPADGMVGIDKDDCRNPETGELTEDAVDLVKRIDSYTEVSPSGTGIKIWAYGTLPPHGRHKRGILEMYCSDRFFTLTGQWLDWTPSSVKYRPDAILAIHREVFGDTPDLTATAGTDPGRPIPALELGDEDVIHLASESPHNGERFRRLWSGDSSDYATDSNGGESEADCGLCELLFYYGGPDRDRADRLFRRSGLYREKWERPDYRKRTFDRALRNKTRFYGDSIQPPAAGSDGAEVCACEDCPSRARVTYLERTLLDREDMIEERDTAIRVQRERLTELRERIDNWKGILSNPRLKPADRIVAIPIIEQMRHAQQLGQAEVHIRHPGIVNGWGLPESTVQKSAAVLTDMPGAPLAKRHKHEAVTYPDPETGQPITATPKQVLYRALADGDLFKVVARYDPGLPQRGGTRHPLEHCPDDPDADLKVRHIKLCAVCRRPVSEPSETTLRLQNDAIESEAPSVDVDGTYCLQNDAVADTRAAAMVAVDTGREIDQYKRVSTKVPLDFEAVREARERVADPDPPDWLDEWPNHEEAPAEPPPERCVFCPEPLAPSSRVACVDHQRAMDDEPLPAVSGGEE